MPKKEERRILIVEDEKPMAHALTVKLNNVGFATKHAVNGDEALECISEGAFDLILLDMVMPQTDGFEVLRQLNEQSVDTPVFVLSNLSQEEDRVKAEELGATEYFVKSNISINDVVERIESQLQ